MDSFIKGLGISKNKFFALIAFALLLRFFLMAFSVHPDFFFIQMFPNLLVSHGGWNVYQLFATELSTRAGFYYSPPVFYFFSLVQFVLGHLLPGFANYMDHAYALYRAGFTSPLDYLNAVKINYFAIFFVMKFPYLIFDAGVLILLMKLIKQEAARKKAFYLWLFCPVTLYGAYMYGQFDIIPTFLLLLGLFLSFKKKPILAILTIGIAATFKNFAVLAILPVGLSLGRNLKEKVMLCILGFIPFIISTGTVFFQAPSQAIYTIIPKFYVAKTSLPVASSVSIVLRYLVFTFMYALVMVFAMFGRVETTKKVIGLSLISLISLFAFTPVILFHYILILLPLLIIFFAKEKWFNAIFFLYIISVAIFKLWTPIQQFGLFAPINNAFLSFPSTSDLINKLFPYSYLSSLFYYVFFILSMFFILRIFYELIFQSDIK